VRTLTRALALLTLGTVLAAPLLQTPASAAPQDGQVVGGARLAGADVVVAEAAPPLPEGLSAQSWLVADLDSGDVLAAKDAHGRYAPASTLKTLTALALLPVLDPAQTVVPTYDDIAVDGSKVGLVEELGYPVHELFTALMMVSGNDAANALATAAGGQAATADLMNRTARTLGAYDTVAKNPHGLDADGQISSAYDLALIARAGMSRPDFARYVSLRRSSVAAPGGQRIEIATKNKLLTSYEGALGIKNGYTSRARASFVGAAERDGRRLVVTLMRADPKVWAEAGRLLDWGFAAGQVEPVGRLVAPSPGADEAGAEAGVAGGQAAATDPAPGALAAPSAGRDGQDGSRLPSAVAGLGLAAAAVLSVRHRDPAAPVAVRRRVPAQRPAPRREPATR
jgi:D-alanyl-D-alanine carboxypeptidase (penicillin-binding protein 5/6)